MIKNKFIGSIDKLFISFVLFLLIYAWINFFTRNLTITFVLSIIFTFSISFLLFFFLNKRNEKNKHLKQQVEDIDKNFLAFRLMSLTEQISLINKIVSQNFSTRIFNNSIVYKNNFKTNKIVFACNIETISSSELINLIQGVKNVDNIIIICNQTQPNLNTDFLKGVTIEIVDKTKLYSNYFLVSSTYPNKEILNTKPSKKKMKEIIKNFFIPQKAKSYFMCGLILIFSSLILPYHYYYLIFGSCLLLASVACKIIPLFQR